MMVVWVAVSLTFMAGLLAVIDGTTMNALFDQEANLNLTEKQLRQVDVVKLLA